MGIYGLRTVIRNMCTHLASAKATEFITNIQNLNDIAEWKYSYSSYNAILAMQMFSSFVLCVKWAVQVVIWVREK